MTDPQTKLFSALQAQNYNGVKLALDEGADARGAVGNGQTTIEALIQPKFGFNTSILKLLLDAGADINQRNAYGNRPLDVAMDCTFEDGIYNAKTQTVERRSVQRPHPSAVYQLFMNGAKASNHDELLPKIRKTLCQSFHHFLNDKNFDTTMDACYEKGLKLPLPDFDAPATDDNLQDPCLPFIQVMSHTGAIVYGLDFDNSDNFIHLVSKIEGPSWEEVAKTLPSNYNYSRTLVQHFYSAVENELISAALLRHLDEKDTGRIMKYASEKQFQSWDQVIRAVQDGFTHDPDGRLKLANLICEGKRPDQVMELAESYHRGVTRLNAALHLRLEELEWQPLVKGGDDYVLKYGAPKEDKYCTITNLTTGKQLVEEGIVQDHCVSGYAAYCLAAQSHIFSLRDSDGKTLSTFELSPNDPRNGVRPIQVPNAAPLYLVQHYAYHNGEPSELAKQMASLFLECIEHGNVALNTKLGDTGKNPRWNKASVLEKNLYHYREDMTPERHQEIFDILVGKHEETPRIRAGRRNYIVPGRFRDMTVDQFMEESGLNAKLKAGLSKMGIDYNPPTPANTQEASTWQNSVDQESKSARAR